MSIPGRLLVSYLKSWLDDPCLCDNPPGTRRFSRDRTNRTTIFREHVVYYSYRSAWDENCEVFMKMFAPKTQSDSGPLRIGIWFNLPIGLRLFLAFMTVILLTALIGALAIQQISSLTDKAAEINARDLPESIILAQLRSLLYQQVDLEQSLLNGNELISNVSSPSSENVLAEASIIELQGVFDATPTPTTGLTPDNQAQQTVAELTTVRKEIAKNCQQLLTLEQAEPGEDLKLAQQITSITGKTNALSARIQALVEQRYVNEARTLEFTQQEPLQLSAVTIVTHMSSLEQTENANDVEPASGLRPVQP